MRFPRVLAFVLVRVTRAPHLVPPHPTSPPPTSPPPTTKLVPVGPKIPVEPYFRQPDYTASSCQVAQLIRQGKSIFTRYYYYYYYNYYYYYYY
jgi:hypothetical protein